jgi:hypothetical protein
MSKLLKNPDKRPYVDLTVSFINEKQEAVENTPTVRFYFK